MKLLNKLFDPSMSFPKNFLWGVATSAYQIEGGNSKTDWWKWEKQGKTKYQSGKACDYWSCWKGDHAWLSELGVNIFRLSIEWSRVETAEGVFSSEAIQKYREILQDLRNRKIKTQVTLWHWTSPIWFQEKYGFHNKKSVVLFSRYAEKITQELGDFIDIFVVFNEPMVPLGQGFLGGLFPPGFKNPIKFWKAVNNMTKAYIEAYKLIHKIKPEAMVGIAYLYNWFIPEKLPLGRVIEKIIKWFRIDLLGNKIKNYQDYFGIDYYRLGKIRFGQIKFDPKNYNYFGFQVMTDKSNPLGWIFYPEGIYKVIKEVQKEHKLPIYILENGLPTEIGLDDEKRIKFIQEHLYYVKKAMNEGADIRGYNFWSLMDNFEWLYGYEPRFGLIEIDFETLERKPRESFYAYKEIIKNNSSI
jgi:beta-glucosidase